MNSLTSILVVSYSQTGQLSRIVDSILAPIQECGAVSVTRVQLEPVMPYPFPWPISRFFDVFPECVTLTPPEIYPLPLSVVKPYDLVILAYQVWFFSPSLPVAAFLNSKEASVVFRGNPVITVIGCKDTWVMAQERVKEFLGRLGAVLIDNVALVDKSPRFYRLISTQRWLWTGKKNGSFKIFPPAGISNSEIQNASRFGMAIVEAIKTGLLDKKISILQGLGAVRIDEQDLKIEKFMYPQLVLWAKLIRRFSKAGQARRIPLLFLFIAWLSLLMALGLIMGIFLYPIGKLLPKNRMLDEIRYYEQPSGSSSERIVD
jgi:hypothetical protein